MRLLVFQHIACEHPGIFRSLLTEAGIDWTPVELDAGEPIPPLEDYDGLWVMGGPMDVWDEALCPWLQPEKEAIRCWVEEMRKPFLGVCLGHQLLADALGGHCTRQSSPEIGILEVSLTPAAVNDPLFAGIDSPVPCLQWHSVAVTELPPDTTVLATSPACECQAIRVGQNAWGIQFHVELEPTTIPEWGNIPAYAKALEETLGPGAMARMESDAEPHFSGFRRNAERLLANFLAVAT